MEITLDLHRAARPRLHAFPPFPGRQDAGHGEGLVFESRLVFANVDSHNDPEEAILTFSFQRVADYSDEVEGGVRHRRDRIDVVIGLRVSRTARGSGVREWKSRDGNF